MVTIKSQLIFYISKFQVNCNLSIHLMKRITTNVTCMKFKTLAQNLEIDLNLKSLEIKTALTLSHLSIHLVWYSCKQGNTLTSCFSSKSTKQTTHRFSSASSFAPAVTRYVGSWSISTRDNPLGFTSPICSAKLRRVCKKCQEILTIMKKHLIAGSFLLN